MEQISRIAAYFRANEPHSPLSYTLEDAVRRARMGLPDLLKEMMPEAAARASVLSGLGIRPLPEELRRGAAFRVPPPHSARPTRRPIIRGDIR